MGRFVFLALVGLGTAAAIMILGPEPGPRRFDHDGSSAQVPSVAATEPLYLNGTVARALVRDGANGVFVGTREGRLFALGPGMSLRWVRELSAGIEAAIALDGDGGVTGGTVDGTVVSWTRDGEVRWTTRLPAPVRGGVHRPIDSDRSFVAAGTRVWALDAQGHPLWSFEAHEQIRSPPVSFGGRVYVAARDDHVYALDAQTGTELWRFQGAADFNASPAVGPSGELYLAGEDGWVRALSSDGTVRWRLALGAPVRAPIGITRDGELLLRTSGGAPELIRLGHEGQRRWVTRLALNDVVGRATVSPAVELPSGQIAAATVNQELLLLDAEGRPVLRVPIEAPVSAPPLVNGELLYLVTQAGAVRELRF